MHGVHGLRAVVFAVEVCTCTSTSSPTSPTLNCVVNLTHHFLSFGSLASIALATRATIGPAQMTTTSGFEMRAMYGLSMASGEARPCATNMAHAFWKASRHAMPFFVLPAVSRTHRFGSSSYFLNSYVSLALGEPAPRPSPSRASSYFWRSLAMSGQT